MTYQEQALTIACEGESLAGIVALPARPRIRGVVIVVGGPQYRVGSHRQFTLLARALATAGIASLRFDYRGMGDSTGEARTFEHVSADLRAAIDALFAAHPGVREVALWGLCDAASAALMYAPGDARVTGLALANPWVRSVAGEARIYLRHYYIRRAVSRDFWRKVLTGRFSPAASAGSLAGLAKAAIAGDGPEPRSFTETMRRSLAKFRGPVLCLLSGKDFVAQEFLGLLDASPEWARAWRAVRVTERRLDEANHTFASAAWRGEVERATVQWLESW